MFELIFQTGKLHGKRLTLPLGKEIVIGREAGCQLLLQSTLISRRHCEVKHVAEGIWVRDLGSQNGTYVNDVAIATPTLLRAGDVLRVGAATFEVQVARAPVAVPAKPKSKEAPISDDAIAGWLSDHEGPPSAGDTTVIHADQTRTPESVPVPATAGTSPAAKKFKSVKDEAADIIRRHWAKVNQQQSGAGDR
jgi:pSer/pThr/pTyr-binding forkhead associated (FHA) protein